jgi:CRISPR/Cas system CSM-associated protein Csm3 (group 7 of RAMP superfamily)
MTDIRITLTIVSLSPLSVGAGGSAGIRADKTIVRDGWNRPIIPGSQVKGKARWAAEQILRGLGHLIPDPFASHEQVEQPTPIRVLFGSPAHCSPLRFADLPGMVGPVEQAALLRTSSEQHQSQIRPSVAINRRRGTAEDQRLLFQETALEGTRFGAERAVVGTLPDVEHVALLWAALRLATRWGGAKSRGLGWSVVEAQVFADGEQLDDEALKQALNALLTEKKE